MVVDIQMISTVIAAVTVTITAIFGLLQLRNYQKHLRNMEAATNVQTIIKLYEIWTNQNMDKNRQLMRKCKFNSYEEWREKYSNNEFGEAVRRVGRLYETFAILARRQAIDSTLLIEILGDALLSDWKFMKPLIYGLREEFNDPTIGINMEWMAKFAENYRRGKNEFPRH